MAPLVGGGSSLNPWPVVMIGVGVASIIACAMIVGSEEGRELTLDEAGACWPHPVALPFRPASQRQLTTAS
jgi:hypothetical protein